MDPDTSPSDPHPPVFNYILSFILVGLAWGFTTPFIRRAAVDFNKRQEEAAAAAAAAAAATRRNQQTEEESGERYHDGGSEEDRNSVHVTTTTTTTTATTTIRRSNSSWLLTRLTTLFWTVINLLRTPGYAIPLVLNLTGSVWFFLLVGKHELSLTVPIINSMAFLFTVLGEWYVERKVIERETWLGMFLVLGGIALCVQSKHS